MLIVFIQESYYRIQCFMAEFLGSFLLCTFGNGSIAQNLLQDACDKYASYLDVNIAYGLGTACPKLNHENIN